MWFVGGWVVVIVRSEEYAEDMSCSSMNVCYLYDPFEQALCSAL